MKEVHLKISNISHKQWTNLLIELNLVKDAWGRLGPKINIEAKNFDQIIKWGKKKHGENTNDINLTVRRDHLARKNRF